MTLPKITKPKRIKKQKDPVVDPNVVKMEKLMGMRLDGIAWFLANYPAVKNHE